MFFLLPFVYFTSCKWTELTISLQLNTIIWTLFTSLSSSWFLLHSLNATSVFSCNPESFFFFLENEELLFFEGPRRSDAFALGAYGCIIPDYFLSLWSLNVTIHDVKAA